MRSRWGLELVSRWCILRTVRLVIVVRPAEVAKGVGVVHDITRGVLRERTSNLEVVTPFNFGNETRMLRVTVFRRAWLVKRCAP